MSAMKIQFRQKELEKFINWGIDNRSARIGVIHDDDVTKVNRKTTLPLSCPRNSRCIVAIKKSRRQGDPSRTGGRRERRHYFFQPKRTIQFPVSSYQLFRVRGSNPASAINSSISSRVIRNDVPALLTTFSSIMTEPKSFAPYRSAI
jgi:hypothetical protein